VQLLTLGNCRDLNIMNLASNCWFSQCYNTRILTAKIVTILFCLLIIQLTIYNRTITRFIADDNVVYQWVRREIRWLASDTELHEHIIWSMWAGDHGELFFCIHLNREWEFHAKSNELTDAFLACPPDWAHGPSLLRDKRGLPLPGCETIVPVLWLLFSRLSMLPSFQIEV